MDFILPSSLLQGAEGRPQHLPARTPQPPWLRCASSPPSTRICHYGIWEMGNKYHMDASRWVVGISTLQSNKINPLWKSTSDLGLCAYFFWGCFNTHGCWRYLFLNFWVANSDHTKKLWISNLLCIGLAGLAEWPWSGMWLHPLVSFH